MFSCFCQLTPLWFYPQDTIQEGDLEEHLIAIPASSMMALQPKLYKITEDLIGGFVLTKESLKFMDFFQPTEDKSFSFQKGLEIINDLKLDYSDPMKQVKLPFNKKLLRSIKKRLGLIKK